MNGPDAAKTILGHGRAFTKSAFYSPFGLPGKSNLFSEPTNTGHAVMRRRLSALYSTSTLLSYEVFIDSCTATLVRKFREFAEARKRVNLPDFMQLYAFDMIAEITVSPGGPLRALLATTPRKGGLILIDPSDRLARILG